MLEFQDGYENKISITKSELLQRRFCQQGNQLWDDKDMCGTVSLEARFA